MGKLKNHTDNYMENDMETGRIYRYQDPPSILYWGYWAPDNRYVGQSRGSEGLGCII